MIIDKLNVTNFRGFASQEFTFDPQFNLIIGDNGAGKTSLLEALAVAAGSWLLGIKGYKHRPILENDIRIVLNRYGSEFRTEKQYPVEISALGRVLDIEDTIEWKRRIINSTKRTHIADKLIRQAELTDDLVRSGDPSVVLPLISHYGTGRFSSSDAIGTSEPKQLSRLDGYRTSIDSRVSIDQFLLWIDRENRISLQQGRDSTVFSITKQAIISCVEGAKDVYYDAQTEEVVVAIADHGPLPFQHLSDGQRLTIAMIGDIAQKAVRLNPQFGQEVLTKTPGIVLIDELDLHLHPKWQRRIAGDLMRIFPSLQFFATTHSPQIIGELQPKQCLNLCSGTPKTVSESFGRDSGWILRYLMGGEERNSLVK